MNVYRTPNHNYYKEYLSNLKAGFIHTRLSVGDNMQLRSIHNNYILFLQKGSLVLSCEMFKNRTFNAGEMVFLPKSTDCCGHVTKDAYMIVLIYDTPEYVYDKMWIESLAMHCEYVCYDFTGLAINEPMKLFLQLMENYLKNNIDCGHLYEIKQKEFFLILQSYYTKEEQVRFLYPSIGRSLGFRSRVMVNYLTAKNATELAQFCGYSMRTFSRKFNEEFGTTPYSWMQKQLAKHVQYRLAEKNKSFKGIAEEFRFSSIEQFIRFCKTHLGDTPSALRLKYTIDYQQFSKTQNVCPK